MARSRTTRSRRTRRKSSKPSFFGRVMKWGLVLGLVFGVYFYAKVQMHWYRPNSDDSGRVSLEIEPGMSVSSISTLLEDKNLIKDGFMFELYARKNSLAPTLQAGEYIIEKNKTYKEIAEVLSHGKSEEVKLTIPEGFTLAQIDDLLSDKGLIEAGELENMGREHEGFIYPDTYFVMGNNFDVNAFVERTKSTLKTKLKPYNEAIEKSGRTLEEIVNMASLIEREAAGKAEMNMISGILWKRIAIGEPLGVDATTRYDLNNWDSPLYTADFLSDSKYNTRKFAGLPPTAIGSPGIDALKAAIYPKESVYLFYLHAPDGQIHYAETNAGHEANKAKHLR